MCRHIMILVNKVTQITLTSIGENQMYLQVPVLDISFVQFSGDSHSSASLKPTLSLVYSANNMHTP